MASVLSAKLDRTDSNTPWGFRLHGGKDFSSPLTIQRVTPGSLAAKCGLVVGDTIVKIGHTPTDTLRHNEAQAAVISSGNSLELAIKRGGGGAPVISAPQPDLYKPSTPSYGGYANPTPQSFNTPNSTNSTPGVNYNVKPKPFVSGGHSAVDGLSSHAAQINIGQGNDETDTTSSHGSDDLPPPPPPPPSQPPPMHGGGGLAKHDHTPASFSTPPPWKAPTAVSPVAPASKPKPAVPTPTQSAVLEDQDDAEVPRYRGYTNPSVQSRTFKILQQQIGDGQENPGADLVKPVQTTPVQPVSKQSDDGRVKAIVNRQYNSPASLYSEKKTTETFSEQSTNIIGNLQREEASKQPKLADDGKKAYTPSDTYRLVQEMDGKETTQESAPTTRVAFNPLAGKYASGLRDETEYKADDPNSPLYKPTESASYKAAQPQLTTPSMSGDFPLPPPEPYKPMQPAKRPEPTIVGHSFPSADVAADTIVQNRSTITIAPRTTAPNTNSGGMGSGFTAKGPKPFTPSQTDAGAAPKPSVAPAAHIGGTWRPNIPTGDRNMKVGKLGEAKSMPASGGAGRIPICNSCGTAIRGPFVLALDKSWCPDHFNCANPSCRRPLIDVGFVEEDGQLYCEKDYEQYMAPRCGKCQGAIVGNRIEATGVNYHPQCFTCSHCRETIGGTSFHVENNEFYCHKDWAQLFQTKCYGCQFPIEPGDRWVEALGQNWHSECFNCSTCQVNLEGQAFFAKAGKPFCKKHASATRFG